jgi:hypothetical protein
MANDITWIAQPRQETFLQMVMDPEGPDEILYGGAAGGGKTDALLIAGILYAHLFKAHVIFFRKTYKELEGKPIPRSKELIPRSMARPFNESKHTWFFHNGGILQFSYLSQLKHLQDHQSSEYALVIWDELTHFQEFMYTYLLTRNRWSKGGLKPKSIGGTNPGGPGHAFVKRYWRLPTKNDTYPPQLPEMVWEAPKTPEMIQANLPAKKRVFIPARLEDNQILMKNDPTYEVNLLMQPEQIRKALREGDWDSFLGQKFGEWTPEIHVIKPFAIPKHWRRWLCHDPGYDNPHYWGWLTVDDDGFVYLYKEYGRRYNDPKKVFYSDQAERVVELNGHTELDGFGNEIIVQDKLDYCVTGKDAFNQNRFNNKTYIDYYQGAGLDFTGYIPANTDRRKRAVTMHEYLKPFQLPDGTWVAKLRVFDTCPIFIETIPSLVADELDQEKVKDDPTVDNPYDAVGYGLMSYHVEHSVAPKEEKPPIREHKDRVAKKSMRHVRRLS